MPRRQINDPDLCPFDLHPDGLRKLPEVLLQLVPGRGRTLEKREVVRLTHKIRLWLPDRRGGHLFQEGEIEMRGACGRIQRLLQKLHQGNVVGQAFVTLIQVLGDGGHPRGVRYL